MPQFDPTFFYSQVFWLFICFFILVGFMRVVIVPRLEENLKKRSDYMAMLKGKEDSYRIEIKEINEKLQELQVEDSLRAKKLLDQVHAKISQEREQQLAELHTKLSKKQQELNEQIEQEISKIQDNMDDLAKELCEKVLTQLMDTSNHPVKKHVHS